MREQSGSRALTAHGTLYKALGRLEERGLLTSAWEDAAAAEGRPRRRLYELTGEGARVAARRSGRRPSSARRLGARMTPERMARLVAAWVRFYTRRQPRRSPSGASRRSTPTSTTTSPTSARPAPATGASRSSIAGRMVRGMAADASAHRPLVRVALATAIVLLVPLIAAAPLEPRGLRRRRGARGRHRPAARGGRAEAAQPCLPGRGDRGRRRRVPVRQRRRRARPRALRLPADRRDDRAGGQDYSVISAVAVSIARPRMWLAIVEAEECGGGVRGDADASRRRGRGPRRSSGARRARPAALRR